MSRDSTAIAVREEGIKKEAVTQEKNVVEGLKNGEICPKEPKKPLEKQVHQTVERTRNGLFLRLQEKQSG
jgi:hypothetical protein